jgi:hypothetical protein
VLVLPLWDPIRLAADVATLDTDAAGETVGAAPAAAPAAAPGR